ncbi:heme biosynthesis protein HemY [Acinetobacter qingfengensis]|uniref:HemY N-terminal domain-containing protein n=1 Tax=Acinetobacter qingfengensis TaxID=1262585 RepID=A0A1E7RD35_9GAMM|nr:heme biosynthesis HemY N-terminal domain-containing protein [Acinetobacter qingfengensis]KAA8732349.1 heme biosynthesis protein HemY [Acinetobacter qingfengensis]OEY97258.1 hypothetical protein BJI46_02225 [Acinetobacter qingfengensis]
MRFTLLTYLCICLLLAALFMVLSFNSGFGYVYIQWLGWQIQSNLFLLLFLLFIASGIFYLLWRLLRYTLRRNLQRYQIPKSFQQLHPYEQLGVLWLLKAERVEQNRIFQTYQNSVLLNPLIHAKLLLKQQQPEQAKIWLQQTPNPLFELTELLKVEIALLERDYAVALERLEFLTVQPLSAWLHPISDAYQAELQEHWLQLSRVCPWWLFKASHQPRFDVQQTQIWFQALLVQREQADAIEQQLFFDWYDHIESDINQNYDIEQQILLLKLINQFDALHQSSYLLAQNILQQRFVPQVLYIWLDKALNHSQEDILVLEQQVQNWQQQYPAQASLTFAQWHIYQRQAKHEQAKHLLSQYPDDAYMAYLRIQDALQHTTSLQQDIHLLLHYSKQDFKFDL